MPFVSSGKNRLTGHCCESLVTMDKSVPRLTLIPIIIFSIVGHVRPLFGQPPPSQTIGGVTRQEESIESRQQLEERVLKEAGPTQEVSTEEGEPADKGPRVLIRSINIEGVTRLSKEEITQITSFYEGRELSFTQMQEAADRITDAYRQKGYVTSRAFIPPQTIKDGVLTIKVVEGRLGRIEIRGNTHFRSDLLKKKIRLRPEGYFDYSALQRSLVYINEHPDRTARAVLVPGEQAGTTDIIIEVEDRLPMHVQLLYDNYGSRYIGTQRYAVMLEHNNVTGHDDRFVAKLQYSDGALLELQQGQYTYPLNPTTNVGGYFLLSELELGEEFASLQARGKARIYGIFLNKAVLETQNLDVRWNFGFDYKSIRNYLSGSRTSRDELRVFKTGFDFNYLDRWGRNILTAEANVGVPDLIGAGLSKDPNASRSGAGSKFVKWLFNYYRLQPLFWDTNLLWRNSAQYSTYTLAASEQFQIGGPYSVRGYPPAEFSGDKGYFTSAEWSLPVYVIPKAARVPGTGTRWRDALRFVTFYDWGFVHLKKPSAGERENQTLKACGFGLNFDIPDRLRVRLEFGYPLGRKPSDDEQWHPWIEAAVRF